MTDIKKIREYLVGMANAACCNKQTAKDIKEIIIPHIDSLQKEQVSEDLEEAANNALKSITGQYGILDVGGCLEMFKLGAKWKEEQFEKNRLEHCNSITNEQAKLEQGFIDQHLDKHQRMPTFLDAIEYGMSLYQEKMMAKAFDFTKEHNTACVLASECLRNHGWFNRERDFNNLWRHLSCVDELFAGKFSGNTKVIVIKED